MIDKFTGQYSFLSNFSAAQVFLDGQPYVSVEHAYQAAKTLDLQEREAIRALNGYEAAKAKKMGRRVTMRPDWEDVKIDVMTGLVRQKFTLHPSLRKKLLATEDQKLVEGNTWGDVYWGVCDGKGENHLGKILMKVRNELRA